MGGGGHPAPPHPFILQICVNSEKEKEQEKTEIATPSSENNPLILRSQVNESLRKIQISHKELNIPNDIVSIEVMSKIFADAQSLLDDKNSIKDLRQKAMMSKQF